MQLDSALKPQESFYFLGSGKQFYAFESEDGKAVIKFIKQSRRKPLPWLAKLPLPSPLSHMRDSYLQKRGKRLSELLACCKLASEELREETGIIADHLERTSESRVVTLIDKLGIAHTINIAQTQFLIQKKADLLTSSISEGQIDGMIELISAISLKGIVNLDPRLKANFGMMDGKMLLIDCGSLKKDPRVAFHPYFQRALFLQLLSLREYLQNNQPEYVAYFDTQIQKAL